jgi:hypothetical protein
MDLAAALDSWTARPGDRRLRYIAGLDPRRSGVRWHERIGRPRPLHRLLDARKELGDD